MPKHRLRPSTVSLPDISLFADCLRDSAVPRTHCGPDSKVLFWNGAMERLFGWSAEEALGLPLALSPSGTVGGTLQSASAYTGWEGISRRRIVRRDKEGRPIEVSLSTWPIRGADGHVTAFVGIYRTSRPKRCVRRSLAEKQLEEIERL